MLYLQKMPPSQRELILLVPPERKDTPFWFCTYRCGRILLVGKYHHCKTHCAKIPHVWEDAQNADEWKLSWTHLPRLWRSQDSLRADVWLLNLPPPRKRQKSTKRALALVLLSQEHGEAGNEQEGHVNNLKLWMPCRGGNRGYEVFVAASGFHATLGWSKVWPIGTWTCSELNGSIWIGWCISLFQVFDDVYIALTSLHAKYILALFTVQPVHLIGLGVLLAASKKTKPQAQIPFAMTGEASKWWDLWLWASPLCNSAFLTRHLASDTGASKDDVGLKGPWAFPNNFDFRQGWTVERTNVDTKTWHDVAPQEIEFVGGPKLAPFAHRIFSSLSRP